MTPQELKNSILQLAIQGKLVEQRPEEGTAEELYHQIQKEEIETVKKNPEFGEDEIPFDIPDSWKLVRIENIAILYNGRAYKQNELLEKGKYPVLRVGNLFTNNKWYYSDLELEPDKYVDNGDLLYSWSASFGPYIWTGGKVIYHYHIWKIQFSKWVDKKFLYYFLLADTERIKRSGHGLAMIHVTKAGTEKRTIPLPPLAEQKRIVAKIEELMPLIDRYEQAWARLEDFNKRFPTDMQKSLLQLAVSGKLVEQRPEEGTGEELYQKIQTEKQSLIRSGKLKKDKPLPEITEDEFPFDIPQSWKWIKLGAVASVLGGKRIPAGRRLTNENTGHIYIRVSDMKNASVLTGNLLYVPSDIYPAISRYIINKEDVYITVAGTIGAVGTIPPELDGANLTENADRLVFSNIDQAWLGTESDSRCHNESGTTKACDNEDTRAYYSFAPTCRAKAHRRQARRTPAAV